MAGKRHPIGRLPYKRASTSHDFLMVAASQTRAKGYVTVDEIIHVLAKFEQPNKVHETARHLVLNDLIAEVSPDSWAITSTGEKSLYDMAGRPVRKRNGRVERYVV